VAAGESPPNLDHLQNPVCGTLSCASPQTWSSRRRDEHSTYTGTRTGRQSTFSCTGYSRWETILVASL